MISFHQGFAIGAETPVFFEAILNLKKWSLLLVIFALNVNCFFINVYNVCVNLVMYYVGNVNQILGIVICSLFYDYIWV